jgi:hypothetical protein
MSIIATPIFAGTDTYVSWNEAQTYFSLDPRATVFVALSSGMLWYLQRATKIFAAIPFQGFRLLSTQEIEFPRKYEYQSLPSPYYGSIVLVDDLGYIYEGTTVPQKVKDACCEEALALYLFLADTDRTERQTMQRDGVKSYSLGGDYSETLGPSVVDRFYGLHSKEAYDLIEPYIRNSSKII